jgi:hypothetical protein
MTRQQLHRLLVAPESLVVDLADAALLALERSLCLEHPRLHVDPAADDPEVRRRARDILRPAARLRHQLRAYRRALERQLREAQADDWPF